MVRFACEAIRRAGCKSKPLAVFEPGALSLLAATHGGKDTQFVTVGQDVIHLPEQSIDKDELDLILR